MTSATVLLHTSGQIHATEDQLRRAEAKLLDATEWRGRSALQLARWSAGLAGADATQRRLECSAADDADERFLLDHITSAGHALVSAHVDTFEGAVKARTQRGAAQQRGRGHGCSAFHPSTPLPARGTGLPGRAAD